MHPILHLFYIAPTPESAAEKFGRSGIRAKSAVDQLVGCRGVRDAPSMLSG